ncbi:uncharacterized protein E0L32_011658 [Thyridium curvatum]|uniref:Karyogamy protein n=1 Tax=Thyridium curvatum TaxID=1093900 RepID=A0A507BG48_9PEZI|nr:uncharacterized protein E0L32_011658 [Thyridium curvatum]TPX18473.1 hypothetical protein E0L32_011658 [Thyridium curvatum]
MSGPVTAVSGRSEASQFPANASSTQQHTTNFTTSQQQDRVQPEEFQQSRQNGHLEPASSTVLTFADLPTDLAQLSFDTLHSHSSHTHIHSQTLNSGDASHDHQNQRGQNQNQNTTAIHHTNNNNNNHLSRRTSSNRLRSSFSSSTSAQLGPADDFSATSRGNSRSPSRPSHRKPSPGLAARLKALGFGASRKSSSPPPSAHHSHERVGRLPEDQLREFDQKHLAGSADPVVERRGRPWKGAIARIPSVASLRGSSRSENANHESDGKQASAAVEEATDTVASTTSDFLPVIETAPPLEMDTNKYRLPDHTNGNGTKVQLDTRQQHLDRDSRLPSASSSSDLPPPPLPPKDSPPLPSTPGTGTPGGVLDFSQDAPIYFNPLGLQRAGSIYTISRASLANQIAQLTSLQLPDAESLSSKVSAIPTAQAAARALIGAADQIRIWIHKASEVISGLDCEDDVEWAAAGGREGLEEVESAITRFEELINVYVGAIEELQLRGDIASVSTDDLNQAVVQMEAIVTEWANIRETLQTVKVQVEIAMEWEELWNVVLGEIQNEMDELSRLVFEMEERRHKSVLALGTGDGVDIGDLETIVEETPPPAVKLQANPRFSLPPFPVSPSSPGTPTVTQDDASLLALFARMQPLRASLDFLPMRLSVFEARAEKSFPTACEELDMRRTGLDASYQKLQKDAESLRKELGEDRWVAVFRNAGRQAQKLYESVERSTVKLREAVDSGMHLTNQPMMAKKIESYEAKKVHYAPAMERILNIIDKGVKERFTVNGEILRVHAETQAKWDELKQRMAELDIVLEEVQADKGQQLRDSISSMLSNDRSTLASGQETPQSSPPSSIIMSSLGIDVATPTNKAKRRSSSVHSHLPQPATARRSVSATGPPGSHLPRKPVSRLSTMPGTSIPNREGSATPTGARNIPRPTSALNNRPRWNTSTVGIDTGHNFKPLTLTSPSPYARNTPTVTRTTSALTPTSAGSSKLPMRSPLGRASSSSPIPEGTPSKSPAPITKLPHSTATNRLPSFRDRISSTPGPYSQQGLASSKPAPRLTNQSSMSSLSNRRASLQPPRPNQAATGGMTPRPASSMASSRRSSMLPTPRASRESSVAGRESPQAIAGARMAMRRTTGSASLAGDSKAKDNRPRWRG